MSADRTEATKEASTMVYYDPAIDGGRLDPRTEPLECSSSECSNLAVHRDAEGYPWCYGCS